MLRDRDDDMEGIRLVRVPADRAAKVTGSVTLIGMPGSGKSAVGRILASRLDCKFIDTDQLIERRYQRPLQAVIDRVGDEAFRKLEEEAVVALSVAAQTVISTGGSVVYSEAAMKHLAAISTIVFLDASVEAIRRHIQSEAPRGIVGMGTGGLETLYQERLPLYRCHAGIVIAMDSETPEQVADHILRELSQGMPAH